MIFNRQQAFEAKAFVMQILESGKEVLIREFKKPRSLKQNRLLWLWLTCIEKETGNERNWLHDHYVDKFLVPETYTLRDITGKAIKTMTRRAHTSGLDTLNMKIFLDKVKLDAEEEFPGLVLLNPEDQNFKHFEEHYSRFLN